MNVLRGDLTRLNALFLLGTTPLLARIWIEAVVWRLNDGPQMLGFQVLHLSAGYWSLPLLASALCFWLYELWAVLIGLRTLVPTLRHSASGKRFVAVGFGSVVLFLLIGDFIQSELSVVAIYSGAAVMVALFLVVVWLVFRRPIQRPSPA